MISEHIESRKRTLELEFDANDTLANSKESKVRVLISLAIGLCVKYGVVDVASGGGDFANVLCSHNR